MKQNLSTPLATLLDGLCEAGSDCQYAIIDLYTISLLNGQILYLAAWDVDVVYNGHTYSSAGPYIERSRIRQALKCEVTQISMTVYANPVMTVNGIPVLQAITMGLFSGATVSVDRLFTTSVKPLDVSLGTMNQFVGQIAEVEELGRGHAKLTVKCPIALLSTNHPRNLYMTGCDHVLFDAGCGLVKSSYRVSGVVGSGATNTVIPTNLTQPGPTSAPTTGQFGAGNISAITVTDVNIPAATYYVVITYTGADGESLPSAEYAIAVTGGGKQGTTNLVLKVTSPASHPADATSWNVYVGLSSGNEQLQQSGLAFGSGTGTFWTQSENELLQGTPPPFQTSAGWFTLGLIQFTSGALSGLTASISAYVNPSGSAGQITVVPPLLQAPASGDTFFVWPGCDRTMATCLVKYNNIANYTGCPFIPLPEQGV